MSWALLLAAAALSDAQAGAIVSGCAVHAQAKRQSHAIAVVDAGGRLLAFRRMDGNAHGIGDFARAKAEATAAWRARTSQLAPGAAETPGFAAAPAVVTVPGGVPVFAADGSFFGAVGVSGEAPADDEACALAGIAAAGLLAAPPRP
jgi:uncharacterized protein GlcG (DUF336 family)